MCLNMLLYMAVYKNMHGVIVTRTTHLAFSFSTIKDLNMFTAYAERRY